MSADSVLAFSTAGPFASDGYTVLHRPCGQDIGVVAKHESRSRQHGQHVSWRAALPGEQVWSVDRPTRPTRRGASDLLRAAHDCPA